MIEYVELEVGHDDIIEWLAEDGKTYTGIIVSLEYDSENLVRVFEWPSPIEVTDEQVDARFQHINLDSITAIKVKAPVYPDEVQH